VLSCDIRSHDLQLGNANVPTGIIVIILMMMLRRAAGSSAKVVNRGHVTISLDTRPIAPKITLKSKIIILLLAYKPLISSKIL
jgi:hypothetical protein